MFTRPLRCACALFVMVFRWYCLLARKKKNVFTTLALPESRTEHFGLSWKASTLLFDEHVP